MSTATTAIQFVVSQIDAEAARRRVTLSDVEREMLRFREAPGLAASTMAAADVFERDYDADAYEKKIAELVRSAYQQSPSTERALWADAVGRITQDDWYLGVMLNRAGLCRPAGDHLRLWLTAIVVLVAIVLVSAVAIPTLQQYFSIEQIGLYGWLALLGAIGLYSLARRVLGADAVDGAVNSVIDTVTLQRKRK